MHVCITPELKLVQMFDKYNRLFAASAVEARRLI